LEQQFLLSFQTKLEDADIQIGETKLALSLPDALGLCVLENAIANNVSGLHLVAAADRAMLGGVPSIDCVLCLDLVNVFHPSTDKTKPFHFARIVLRATPRASRLCELTESILKEFCEGRGVPFFETGAITKYNLEWLVDDNGKFYGHRGEFS
jgi:hypothetical protein